MSIPAAELIAAWDVHDVRWREKRGERSAWLTGHGLPADRMWRCEFYLLDAPFARIFTYARDAEDRLLWECACQLVFPHGCGTCSLIPETRDVPVSEFPPRELL